MRAEGSTACNANPIKNDARLWRPKGPAAAESNTAEYLQAVLHTVCHGCYTYELIFRSYLRFPTSRSTHRYLSNSQARHHRVDFRRRVLLAAMACPDSCSSECE